MVSLKPPAPGTPAAALADLRIARLLCRRAYAILERAALTHADAWAGGQLIESGRYVDASFNSLEGLADRLGVYS